MFSLDVTFMPIFGRNTAGVRQGEHTGPCARLPVPNDANRIRQRHGGVVPQQISVLAECLVWIGRDGRGGCSPLRHQYNNELTGSWIGGLKMNSTRRRCDRSLLVMAVVACMGLSLAGCGNDDSNGEWREYCANFAECEPALFQYYYGPDATLQDCVEQIFASLREDSELFGEDCAYWSAEHIRCITPLGCDAILSGHPQCELAYQSRESACTLPPQ